MCLEGSLYIVDPKDTIMKVAKNEEPPNGYVLVNRKERRKLNLNDKNYQYYHAT